MKTKKITLAIIAVALFLGVSCKEEDKKEAAPAEVETTQESTTTASLNPEHGAPGHRCDIPVGAPLSSANGTNTTPATPTTTSPAVSPVWTDKAAPKKNPAHGQPGHDCSVPVGADLNS